MNKTASKLKEIVKRTVAEKPSFGTDPMEPWSAKYNVTEDAALDRYLLSRGLNPKYVNKDLKVSHAKSNAFINWKSSHSNEIQKESMTSAHTPVAKRQHQLKKSAHFGKEIRTNGIHGSKLHSEAVDKRDTVIFDIPFLIRVLEYAREDAKTDMDLHKVVTKLIQIRNKGVLTMKDYNFVTRLKEHFEIDGIITEQECKCSDEKEWKKKAQARSEIWRRKRLKIDEETQSVQEGLGRLIAKMINKSTSSKKTPLPQKTDRREFEVPGQTNKPVQEDKYQDPMAATQTVGSEVDTDSVPKRKREMTKSARMIKSIYKKKRVKNVKEELYDHEKEDKGAKFGEKPFAAAVLKGGKTMTGTQRDTIEIDPMMRAKPGKVNR